MRNTFGKKEPGYERYVAIRTVTIPGYTDPSNPAMSFSPVVVSKGDIVWGSKKVLHGGGYNVTTKVLRSNGQYLSALFVTNLDVIPYPIAVMLSAPGTVALRNDSGDINEWIQKVEPAHYFATMGGLLGGVFGIYYAYKQKSGVLGFLAYYFIFGVIATYFGYVVDATFPISKTTLKPAGQ